MRSMIKSFILMLGVAVLQMGCSDGTNAYQPDKVETDNRDKLDKVEAATDDEMVERQRIMDRASAAIKTSDFVALNAMALDYRSTRALTPSGTWKLTSFYQRLEFELTNREQLSACKNPESQDFLNRWTAFSPKEPTVHIMTSRLNRRIAWCVRGGAYANKVLDKDMEVFGKLINQTYEQLSDVSAVASKDPEFFVEMIHLYPNMGASKFEFMDLVNQAMNAEPYYYAIYFEARPYLQEKWLGEAGDLQKFDDYVTDATKSGAGKGTYARIQWFEMNDKFYSGDPAFHGAVNWPKWKTAMRDVATQYPNDWNLSKFASFSCTASDYEEARYYFERMKTNILAAWSSEAAILGCKNSTGFKGEVELDRRTSW